MWFISSNLTGLHVSSKGKANGIKDLAELTTSLSERDNIYVLKILTFFDRQPLKFFEFHNVKLQPFPPISAPHYFQNRRLSTLSRKIFNKIKHFHKVFHKVLHNLFPNTLHFTYLMRGRLDAARRRRETGRGRDVRRHGDVYAKCKAQLDI